MQVCIALVRLKDKSEAILRGSPEEVSFLIFHGTEQSGGGEILCQIQDHVFSKEAEDELWVRFIEESAKVGCEKIAAEKHQIWRRKAAMLWLPGGMMSLLGGVCVFMRDEYDMILKVSEPNKPFPYSKRSVN